MANHYLFTGEESYLINKEILRRTTNFTKKHGPDTVMSVVLGEYTPSEIMQILCSGGLFSEEKLIIVYDMPGQTTSPKGTTDLESLLITQWDMLHPDYFIIFVSYKPDKRKKAYKFFSEHCETKVFNAMDMRSIPKFLTAEFSEYYQGTQHITKEHISHIVELVGNDGRRLSSEVRKLCDSLNSDDNNILNKELIDAVVSPSQESTAFELVDELLIPPSDSLLNKIDTLVESGEVRQAIHGGLLRGLKAIISYGFALQYKQDTKALGLPPFVAGKYNKYQDNIIKNLHGYMCIYNGLLQYDYHIKSGQTDDKGYWLQLKKLLSENNFIS